MDKKSNKLWKSIKGWILATVIVNMGAAVIGFMTLLVLCIVIVASVSNLVLSEDIDWSAVEELTEDDTSGSSLGNIYYGQAINMSSSLDIDYPRILSLPETDFSLLLGQVTQLLEAMQSKYGFPALMLIYSKQYMESSALVRPSTRNFREGMYDIYKYSCARTITLEPGGRQPHSQEQYPKKGRPDPWYNHGAYGFLQIEGDVWVSGDWTLNGVSYISENRWILSGIKKAGREEEFMSILASLGHGNISDTYTSILGKKHTTFKEFYMDMGCMPFQMGTAIYYCMNQKVYENGVKHFGEQWNSLSEQEKRVVECIALLYQWNGGNFGKMNCADDRYSPVYQKFIIDLAKHLCAYGRVYLDENAPDSYVNSSNQSNASSKKTFEHIARVLYGADSEEYKAFMSYCNAKIFNSPDKWLGEIYCVKAILGGQYSLEQALERFGCENTKVSIYNLSVVGNSNEIIEESSDLTKEPTDTEQAETESTEPIKE